MIDKINTLLKALELDVTRIFKENKIWYDWWTDFALCAICINIEWGDWKHDHGYMDYLMRENGYVKFNEDLTETDGSDCYSSIHYYRKPVD